MLCVFIFSNSFFLISVFCVFILLTALVKAKSYAMCDAITINCNIIFTFNFISGFCFKLFISFSSSQSSHPAVLGWRCEKFFYSAFFLSSFASSFSFLPGMEKMLEIVFNDILTSYARSFSFEWIFIHEEMSQKRDFIYTLNYHQLNC